MASWNNSIGIPSWPNRTNTGVPNQLQDLYVSTGTLGSNYIGITKGNTVALPTTYPSFNVSTMYTSTITAHRIHASTIDTEYAIIGKRLWMVDPTMPYFFSYGTIFYNNYDMNITATSNITLSAQFLYTTASKLTMSDNVGGLNLISLNLPHDKSHLLALDGDFDLSQNNIYNVNDIYANIVTYKDQGVGGLDINATNQDGEVSFEGKIKLVNELTIHGKDYSIIQFTKDNILTGIPATALFELTTNGMTLNNNFDLSNNNLSACNINVYGVRNDPTINFYVPVNDEHASVPYSTITLEATLYNVLSNSGTFTTFSNVTILNGERDTTTLNFDSNITLTAYPTELGWGHLNINGDVNIDKSVSAQNVIGSNATFSNNANIQNIISHGISTIYISTLAIGFSTFNGDGGNYISTSLGNLLYLSTFVPVSNWAKYPANHQVEMDNNTLNNVNTINVYNNVNSGGTLNGVTVATSLANIRDGVQFASHENTNRTFNNWMNTVTADGQTNQNLPYTQQYLDSFYVGINCLDIENLFNDLTSSSGHISLRKSGAVVPTGELELVSQNMTQYLPRFGIPPWYAVSWRAQAYFGTGPGGIVGGALAYVRMNYDQFSTDIIPDTSALIEINAESALGIGAVLGSGRISITGGQNYSLGTFTNSMVAGYGSLVPPYVLGTTCMIYQSAPFTVVGGGYTENSVHGGQFGARNDMVCFNDRYSRDPVYWCEMNLYCKDDFYVYSEGNLWVGYGGASPRYGSNNAQNVHVLNVNDIQGNTHNGMDLLYTNSVQFGNISSFISNVHYLVGYSQNNYLGETLESYTGPTTSTVTYMSNIPSTVIHLESGDIFKYNSTIVTSTVTYNTTFIRNNHDVSSFNKTIGATIAQSNWIEGISTTLSSFNIVSPFINVSTIQASNIQTNYIEINNNGLIYTDPDGFLTLENKSGDPVIIKYQLATDSIASETPGSDITIQNSLNLNNSNIKGVNTLAVSAISSFGTNYISMTNTLNMNKKNITYLSSLYFGNPAVEEVGNISLSNGRFLIETTLNEQVIIPGGVKAPFININVINPISPSNYIDFNTNLNMNNNSLSNIYNIKGSNLNNLNVLSPINMSGNYISNTQYIDIIDSLGTVNSAPRLRFITNTGSIVDIRAYDATYFTYPMLNIANTVLYVDKSIKTPSIGTYTGASLIVTTDINMSSKNISNIDTLTALLGSISTLNVNSISSGSITTALPSNIFINNLVASNVSTNYISSGLIKVSTINANVLNANSISTASLNTTTITSPGQLLINATYGAKFNYTVDMTHNSIANINTLTIVNSTDTNGGMSISQDGNKNLVLNNSENGNVLIQSGDDNGNTAKLILNNPYVMSGYGDGNGYIFVDNEGGLTFSNTNYFQVRFPTGFTTQGTFSVVNGSGAGAGANMFVDGDGNYVTQVTTGSKAMVVTNGDGTSGILKIDYSGVGDADLYLDENGNLTLSNENNNSVQFPTNLAIFNAEQGSYTNFYINETNKLIYYNADVGPAKAVASDWSYYPAETSIDMCNYNISNVNTITSPTDSVLTLKVGLTQSSGGQIVVTNADGTSGQICMAYEGILAYGYMSMNDNRHLDLYCIDGIELSTGNSDSAVRIGNASTGTAKPGILEIHYEGINDARMYISDDSNFTMSNGFGKNVVIRNNLDMCNFNLSNVNIINTSNLNVITLSNNNPATPIQARIGINMCNNDLTNCGNIELKAQKNIVGLSNMRFDTGITANTFCYIYTSTIGTLATTITSQLVFSNTTLTDSPCVFATGIDMGTNGKLINVTQINGASYPPTSTWVGNATSDLYMNGHSISNATTISASNLNVSSNVYYGSTRQPFIQFGSNNTGTGTGTTVSLPVSYINNTYSVHLTYIGSPSGNQPLYVVSQTTSNFIFHGANSAPTGWTTYGFNN